MRASHELSRVEVSFDDPNLVSHAGLLQVASLWQRLGMPGVVRRGLRLPGSVGANSDAKVATVIMGMLAGADSIDDLDVLRAGATGRLLGAAKAPSTIGTWLRSFTYGHLRQLDAIARQLLLVCWAAGAGPHRLDELLYLDLDSTIIETHGLAKQGAFFGYTKVRGHHPLIARVSEPRQPGWIAPYSRHTAARCTGSPARFRRGNAAAGLGWRAFPGRDDQPGPGRRLDRGAAGPRRQRLLRQPVHRLLPPRRREVQRDRPQRCRGRPGDRRDPRDRLGPDPVLGRGRGRRRDHRGQQR